SPFWFRFFTFAPQPPTRTDPLSLHDALPISLEFSNASTIALILGATPIFTALIAFAIGLERLHGRFWVAAAVSFAGVALIALGKDRKSTRLNSSHVAISYAVFCLKTTRKETP